VREPDACVLDLAVAGLAAEVMADLPDVRDPRGGDRVALRLEPARDVDRVLPSRAPPDRKSAAPPLQAEVT
jgi:hypothetical protein